MKRFLNSVRLSAIVLPFLHNVWLVQALVPGSSPAPPHSIEGGSAPDHEANMMDEEGEKYESDTERESIAHGHSDYHSRNIQALVQDWEKRVSTLREEMRQSQKQLEDQVKTQGGELSRLRLQLQRQEERCQGQGVQIHRLKELVLQLSEDSRELGREKERRVPKTIISENATEQHRNRQFRSDDVEPWEPVVGQISNQVETMNSDLQVLKDWADITKQNSGTTYVRWGSRTCPRSAELLYTGYVGGSHFDTPGAAVNYLCLPQNPVFDGHSIPPALNSHNHVQVLYGGEYQAVHEEEHDKLPACAVCHTPKSSTVLIPATDVCTEGWTPEYHGYLMAGATTHAAASEFVCVDVSEDYVAGTEKNEDGKLLYYTVTHCGSLPCPPYVNNKIVTCVVCSK